MTENKKRDLLKVYFGKSKSAFSSDAEVRAFVEGRFRCRLKMRKEKAKKRTTDNKEVKIRIFGSLI